MNKQTIVIIALGILFSVIAPPLFIQPWSPFDFTETGQIGDTIGGITAPIIGILSIALLVCTLKEQIKFSKRQKEISVDEQFKTTFFNLLKAQREISNEISGQFSYLGTVVSEEFPQNIDVQITKKDDLERDKEVYRIKNFRTIAAGEARGADFFKGAKYQLQCIYESLEYEDYHADYDLDMAFQMEEELECNVMRGNDSQESRRKHAETIYKYRMPFRCAYVNDKYRIHKSVHDKYKQLSEENKIGLGYAYFYHQYETVECYFRHLYQILNFIKMTENEKVRMLGRKASYLDKKRIHEQFEQYAQFLQSQMSVDELVLLYYNSFTFKETQELIIKYDLLKNLPIQSLIRKEHVCKPEIKLMDKSQVFLDLINR
jgi:hypothetical protein